MPTKFMPFSGVYECRNHAKWLFPAVLVTSLIGVCTSTQAQIVEQNGASQQDTRSTPAAPTEGMPQTTVHESMKPQAKQEAKNSDRPKSSKPGSGQGSKAAGGGGFQNGLYGTGAGSNR